MRILVVTNLFEPDRGGGASVITDLVHGLSELGHQVVVQTAYPYYPEWHDKSGQNGFKVRHEKIRKLDVYRHGMFIPGSPSRGSQRALQEVSFFLSLSRGMWSRGRFDLVIAYCPLISAVAYASLRRVLRREPAVLSVQDIPADAATAGGIVRTPLLKRASLKVQRFLFRQFDSITTIAPPMVQRIEKIIASPQPTKNVVLLPNFLHASMECSIARHAGRRAPSSADSIRLLYAGNIGRKQDLIRFCNQLSGLDAAFTLRIFGDGSEAHAVQEWIRERDDARISIGPFLPEDDFAAELCSTDIFVVTEVDRAEASFLPSKLIPAVCAGTPILAVSSAASPLALEVAQHGLGLSCSWSDIPAALACLTAVLHSPNERAQLAAALAHRSLAFHRTLAIERMNEVVEEFAASTEGA